MSLKKYDTLLSFDLPKGYEVVKSTNDEGATTYAVNAGKTTDENGETIYKYLSNIFDGEKNENPIEDADDASAIKLHSPFRNLFRIYENKTELLGLELTITLAVGFVIYKEKAYCINSTLVGGIDDDRFEGWVDFLNGVLGAMRFEGQAGNFEKLTSQMIRNRSNIEDETEHPYPIARPNPDQHSHLDFLARTAGALGMLGGLIQVNQTGTEYSFERIDEDFLERFDSSRTLMNIVKADNASFALADTARKMGEIFRVNEAVFDESEDREQEIEEGLVRRCGMYEAFRSFAWTLAAHCDKAGVEPDVVDIDTLEEIANFVVDERNKLNYTADSFCPVLCSGDDIHNYYIPDATSAQAKNALIKTMSEDDTEDNDYDPEAHILSLDGLRKDLEYLYPSMQTIYDSLAATRDFDEHLEGAIAEVLYVWCAMTYAARTPIYSEDGPVNCGWLHPGKKATILPPRKKTFASAAKKEECEFSFTFSQGLKYENEVYSFKIPDGFIIRQDDENRDFVAFLPDAENPENQLLSKFIIYAGVQSDNELFSQLHIPEAFTAVLVAGSTNPIDLFAKTKRLFYERKDLPCVINYCYDTINRCIHAYANVAIGTASKLMRFQITVSNTKQYSVCEKLIYQFLDGMIAKKQAKMLQDLDDNEFATMSPGSTAVTHWGKLIEEYTQQLQVARMLYQKVLVSAFETKQQSGNANIAELKKDLREMLRYLTQSAEKYLKKADAVFQIMRVNSPDQTFSAIKKKLSALSEELSQYVELDGQRIAATAAYRETYKKHTKLTPDKAIADILAVDTTILSSSTIQVLRDVSGNTVLVPKVDSVPKQPVKDPGFQQEKTEEKILADKIAAMEKKRQKLEDDTKAIRSALSDIQTERQKAERKFGEAKRKIERMTSGYINVYSYDLESRIREVIETANDAGELLNKTCIDLVKKLDKKCRTYTYDGMDPHLIKAIADEIYELNETAVVDIDFTGSFEGTSFGNVGKIQYKATPETKSIESYWRTKARTSQTVGLEAALLKEFGIREKDYQRYRDYEAAVAKFKKAATSKEMVKAEVAFVALKGYLDAESYIEKCKKAIPDLRAKEEKEAAEQAELEAKRKAEEEERARKAAKEMRAYEEKYAAWSAEKKEIEARRAQELKTAIDAYRAELNAEVQKWHQEEQQLLADIEDSNRKKKAYAEAELASLGFFKFKEKTACKETIQQAERVLSGLPAERNRLSVAYQNKKSDIDKKVRAEEGKLKAKIEKENPIPIEPQKPAAYKPASTPAPKRTKRSSQTPDKIFLGYTFVVADMPSGSEDARIRREIKLRGGTPVTSVTQKLDYLVCSRVARGITTRIDAALDNQAKGFPVKIITIREFDEMISKG